MHIDTHLIRPHGRERECTFTRQTNAGVCGVRAVRFLVLLVLLLSAPRISYSQVPHLAPIPGLDADIYFTYSGVWDEWSDIDSITNKSTRVFSWGKSNYLSDSVLIDFGAPHPYLQQYTSRLEVLSVKRTGKAGIRCMYGDQRPLQERLSGSPSIRRSIEDRRAPHSR